MSKMMFLLLCALLLLQMPLRHPRVPAGVEAGLRRMVVQEQKLSEEMIGLMEREKAEEPDRRKWQGTYLQKAKLAVEVAGSCSSR